MLRRLDVVMVENEVEENMGEVKALKRPKLVVYTVYVFSRPDTRWTIRSSIVEAQDLPI